MQLSINRGGSLTELAETMDGRTNSGSSGGRELPSTTSHNLLAGLAVPDANVGTLNGILTTELAGVSGVLKNFNLLNDLTERCTVTSSVLTSHSNLLSSLGHGLFAVWRVSTSNCPVSAADSAEHQKLKKKVDKNYWTNSVDRNMEIDLLHPEPAVEKTQHKLKRLIQGPNSTFFDVKCKDCKGITTVYSHSQNVVTCSNCTTVLAHPTGGKVHFVTEAAIKPKAKQF